MAMNIDVSFPGGKRVDARVGDFVVRTDQPPELGGEGSAVAPFDLFLASLATCAGAYVLAFCQARKLSTEGLEMRLVVAEQDPATKLPVRIRIELHLPALFPTHLLAAVVRAAESCKVKKTIAAQPLIEVALTSAAHAPVARAS
jgi:putative redox protein